MNFQSFLCKIKKLFGMVLDLLVVINRSGITFITLLYHNGTSYILGFLFLFLLLIISFVKIIKPMIKSNNPK